MTTRAIIIAAFLGASLLVPSLASAQEEGDGGYRHHHMRGEGGEGMMMQGRMMMQQMRLMMEMNRTMAQMNQTMLKMNQEMMKQHENNESQEQNEQQSTPETPAPQ